jgi:hypothetical protein
MWLASLTVVVGGLMLVSQYMQNRASTNLEKAQSALSEEQERLRLLREEQVAKDLKEKDERIAQLDLERVKLQERLLWEGPRANLIIGAQHLFVERLGRFRGQKYVTSVCGKQAFDAGGMPTELTYAENAIALSLRKAGWVTDDPFPRIDTNCAAELVIVYARNDAPQRTRDASVELKILLNELLSQNIEWPSRGQLAQPLPILAPSPGEFIHPSDVIEISVGRHPLFPHPPTGKSQR